MLKFPTSPPPPVRTQRWEFPSTSVRTLANGTQVAVIRMPALPIVTVRWCFVSGRLHESPHGVGAGFLLQRMLRHGTHEMNASELARHLDFRGIRLGTQVSVDSTVVSVSALREYLSEAIHIANDVVFNPALPESALSLERNRAIHLHQQAKTSAEALMTAGLSHAMYGSHPYGRPATTQSGLRNTQIGDIRRLHEQICNPSRALLIVVGDVEPNSVLDAVSQKVSDFRASPSCREWSAPHPPKANSSILMVECPGAEQVAVGVGGLAMPRNDPDFLALRVVNHVLGGGAASRLFRELRERQGLTYGAYSQLDCGLWGGDLTASMMVEPSKTNQAIHGLSNEMSRIGAGVISDTECDESIDYLVGSFPQRASGLSGVSSLAMAAWLHGLPPHVWRDYQASLRRVTKEQAQDAAREWLSRDKLSWVVCGAPNVLEDSIETIRTLGEAIRRVDGSALVD